MLITDVVLSLSGIATFSDGSNAPFGANYDRKGGLDQIFPTTTHAANHMAGNQMHELTCGFDKFGENFHTIITTMLEDAGIYNAGIYNAGGEIFIAFGQDPGAGNQKLVTDLVFKISGMATMDNGRNYPLMIMYQKGVVSSNFAAVFGSIDAMTGAEDVDNSDYWSDRLFYTAFEALGTITIIPIS